MRPRAIGGPFSTVNVQLAELDLRRAAPRLQRLPAEEVLREVVQAYAPDVALSCSFGGPSGMVLVDMLARLDLLDDVEVYYLDTGLLFQATHEVRERIERRYGFEATAYHAEMSLAEQAAQYGAALWDRDPDSCCGIRKVGPNWAGAGGQARLDHRRATRSIGAAGGDAGARMERDVRTGEGRAAKRLVRSRDLGIHPAARRAL